MLSDRDIREIEEGRRHGLTGPLLHTWLERLLADRRERAEQLTHVRRRLQQAYVYLDTLLRGLAATPEAEGPTADERRRVRRDKDL